MKTLIMIFALICGCKLIASPIDNLTSPSPEIRAAAAKILRTTYTPPPQTNWDSLLVELKVGDKMTNIETILRAHGIKRSPGAVGEQLLFVDYKLNEAWTLRCLYRYQGEYRGNETLYDYWIFFYPEWRPLAYPSNFTGIWIEYWINGQKCMETTLTNGTRWGNRTCYDFQNGRIVYVEHYDPKNPKNEKTDFYGYDGSIERTEDSVPHAAKLAK